MNIQSVLLIYILVFFKTYELFIHLFFEEGEKLGYRVMQLCHPIPTRQHCDVGEVFTRQNNILSAGFTQLQPPEPRTLTKAENAFHELD